MLPGQWKSVIAVIASLSKPSTIRPAVSAASRTKCSTNNGTSPGPLPQGRQFDVDDVDAIVQILPKTIFGDRSIEIFVGRETSPAYRRCESRFRRAVRT